MCGIIGYLGKKSLIPVLINGLKCLEYRGYDSAGVAYFDDDALFQIYKSAGKLANLEVLLSEKRAADRNDNNLHVGIGHIRWATHGVPNEINAHPHASYHKEIVLAHNGIIENYGEIRQSLIKKGFEFASETDTECLVNLLEDLVTEQKAETPDDFAKVIQLALEKVRGAYALNILWKKHSNHLFVVRSHAPLVVGIGDEEYFSASDAVAIIEHTNKIVYLKEREIAELSPEGIRMWNTSGKQVLPVVEQVDMGPLRIDKKGYKHFMLKEIHEQPDVVRNSLSGRLVGADVPIQLLSREADDKDLMQKILTQTDRVVIIGCGTSFNAGLVGKYFIEELVQIPVEVEAAGEYRYRNPVITDKTLILAISQSGETADTLEAVRLAKEKGANILTVTNREDSSLARESHIVLPVRAGIEVSVCATKSFVAQIVVLYLVGIAMAEMRETYSLNKLTELKRELVKIPALIEAVLSHPEHIQTLAKQYGSARDVLFIARGINYPVALEGALKLKEISYIHAEGYSGSELKHGPIAMLDSNLPVIAVLVPGIVLEKAISNCQEAKARDAQVVGVTSAPGILNGSEGTNTFEALMAVPQTDELLSPLVTTVPLQLLAYYIAEYLGKDVDQPRNLAKSVTVE